MTWPPPDHLKGALAQFERGVLAGYLASTLTTNDGLCEALGHIQGEFLAIHPFREGNARTIKLITDPLAAQTGRPILLYDASDAGTATYIEAAKTAMLKDYAPMTAVVRRALKEARRET